MDKKQFPSIIIGKLLNIGGMLQRHGNKLLLPFDLNQQQFSILFDIVQAGKVKQKELVNRLLLEKAHVSKVVKKLHGMGLISITAPDEDRRSYWLVPTQEGEQTIEKCMNKFNEWNAEWVSEIDDKQIEPMLESLAVLQAIFREKTK